MFWLWKPPSSQGTKYLKKLCTLKSSQHIHLWLLKNGWYWVKHITQKELFTHSRIAILFCVLLMLLYIFIIGSPLIFLVYSISLNEALTSLCAPSNLHSSFYFKIPGAEQDLLVTTVQQNSLVLAPAAVSQLFSKQNWLNHRITTSLRGSVKWLGYLLLHWQVVIHFPSVLFTVITRQDVIHTPI